MPDNNMPSLDLNKHGWPFQVRQKEAGDFFCAVVEEGVASDNFRVCQTTQVVLAFAGILHRRRDAVWHQAVLFWDVHVHWNEMLPYGMIR